MLGNVTAFRQPELISRSSVHTPPMNTDRWPRRPPELNLITPRRAGLPFRDISRSPTSRQHLDWATPIASTNDAQRLPVRTWAFSTFFPFLYFLEKVTQHRARLVSKGRSFGSVYGELSNQLQKRAKESICGRHSALGHLPPSSNCFPSRRPCVAQPLEHRYPSPSRRHQRALSRTRLRTGTPFGPLRRLRFSCSHLY